MSDFDETLNEEELNIITLTDEDGTDKDFEFLDLIDLDDKEYVVLLPVESEDENADGEVIILEVHPLDEENEEYFKHSSILVVTSFTLGVSSLHYSHQSIICRLSIPLIGSHMLSYNLFCPFHKLPFLTMILKTCCQ